MISDLKNKILYYVAPWSDAQRIRFTVLFLVLLVLGWYVLIQRPLIKKINALGYQHSESIEGNNFAKDLCEQELKKKQRDVENIKNQLPVHCTLDALSLLLSYARESGIQFEVLSSDVERKKEFYAKVPIRIRFCAQYQMATDFLSKVSEQKQLFSIKHCSLESVPDKRGHVACSCLIATYLM